MLKNYIKEYSTFKYSTLNSTLKMNGYEIC